MNQRTEFVTKARKTENFSALCREYGISRQIGYKWMERYEAEGVRGMADRSRKFTGDRPGETTRKVG